MDVSRWIEIAVALIMGGVVTKFISSKKETAETMKTKAETTVLTEKEERDQNTFWAEQFDILQEKYIQQNLQLEKMEGELRKWMNTCTGLMTENRAAQQEIMLLKLELEAYKK